MGQPRLHFTMSLLALSIVACSGQGGCGGLGDPVTTHVDKQFIQNNAMQARLTRQGFDFIETDLIKIVEAALQKPLAAKIPKTPIKNPDTGFVYATVCDKPDGCDATLKVIPGSLEIARTAPGANGKSQLTVNARIEIEAKNILYMPADPGYPARDCQIDLRYMDHFADVCRAPGVSWAKANNPYNSAPAANAGWQSMKNACNTYCSNTTPGVGRGVGAAISIGVDTTLGFPEVSVDGIQIAFEANGLCPAAGDVRVHHPKRDYTCVDGSKHPECEVFERSIFVNVPASCIFAQYAFDAAASSLQPAITVGAIVAINQELKKALSVPCTQDSDCQNGATCGNIAIASGFPENCVGTACLLQPAMGQVCNANGKPVPPLAGIEKQLNLAKLTEAYTPDNAGPVKVIAAMGGFVGNDSNADLQTLGLPESDDKRGLTIGGFFGIETHRASCVTPKARPQLHTVAPLILPDQVELFDSTTKQMAPKDYHAAVSLHKDALSQLAYAIYTNGALCLSFSGTADFPLNSQILSFIVTSVKDLDLGGGTRPAFLYVYPEEIPEITIGEGRIHYEGTKPVIDSPHMTLTVKRLRIEFYSSVRDRFVRLFSLGLDFSVGAFLEFRDDNTLLPVTTDLKGGIANVSVKNVELLSEKSADLERTIPGLLDFALPLVSKALLDGIALPQPTLLPGYEFKLLGFRGVNQVAPGSYEFLSGFGRLQRAATAPARDEDVVPVTPRVSVKNVRTDNDQTPSVTLTLASDEAGDIEYAHSLNGGVYSPFSRATEITLQREQFRFAQGPHKVSVIARRVGKTPMSEAVTASFLIEATEESEEKAADASTAREGCSATGTNNLAWLLALAALLLRRRRR